MRSLTGMFTLVLLTLAVGAAQAAARVAPPQAKPAAAKAPAPHPSSLVATGTIASFNGSTNELTIKTSKGQEQFMLAPSARIQDSSSKTIATSELEKMTGRKATVHYTEAGGQKTVQSVRLSHGSESAKKS
jgi:hypothetical protein